jgi:hypothetical protein
MPAIKTSKGTYIGRRQTVKGPLAYFWEFEGENAPKGYRKQIAPALIGEVFLISTEEGQVYVRGEHAPKKVGLAGEGNRSKWGALDASHYQAATEERASKALAKRKDLFERNLEPLRVMANSLPSHSERAAFIARVTSELWRRI